MLLFLISILVYLGVLTDDIITSTQQIDTQIQIPNAIVKLIPYSYSLINTNDTGLCTGVVISDYWILTANHCAVNSLTTVIDQNLNSYTVVYRYKLPKDEIAFLKVDKPFINIIPIKIGIRKENSGYIFGNCPYVHFHVPRYVTYINTEYFLSKNKSGQVNVYFGETWNVLKNKFVCGGDSGAPLLEIQNNEFIIVGVLSSIQFDLVGQILQEVRGHIFYVIPMQLYDN